MNEAEITLGEVARRVDRVGTDIEKRITEIRNEFKADLAQQRVEMSQRVHQETYAADMRALQQQMAAQKTETSGARRLSMWAVGIMVTIVVTAAFGLLLTIAEGPP